MLTCYLRRFLFGTINFHAVCCMVLMRKRICISVPKLKSKGILLFEKDESNYNYRKFKSDFTIKFSAAQRT